MQPFVIKLGSLASGTSSLKGHAGAEFFGIFGNTEILDADIAVSLILHNHGVTLDAECEIEGTVTVPCDRCMDDLIIPVSTGFEESYVPEGDELDLSQDIYDYVCTSLPFRRIHPEGECNAEAMVYLANNI